MLKIFKLLPLLLLAIFSISCSEPYARHFTGESLRVDYYAAGDRSGELAELISLRRTPLWSGPQKNLVDTADLGDYRIVLKDFRSGEVLYSSGFSTLFGEWRTTAEAMEHTEKYYL